MIDKDFDVFLSYNVKDKRKAEILASRLIDEGLRVWFDQWQVIPGSDWKNAIENAIFQTKIICICIGSHGLGESIEKEILGALSSKRLNTGSLIIPILLPGSSPEDIPTELRDLQFADLRNIISSPESLKYLVEIIQRSRNKMKNVNSYRDDKIKNDTKTNSEGVASELVFSREAPGSVSFHSDDKPGLFPLPHQIPPPPYDFKGRDDELRDILIDVDRGATIIALRGMGGIGKTALALVLAYKLKDRFPDGQLFLDLRGTSNKSLTPTEAMAHVIRAYSPSALLPEVQNKLRGQYLSVLAGKRALLLLDDVASREQVEALLPPVGCSLIITSRRRFALPNMKVRDLDTLSTTEARDLLILIAERIGDNADELAELCGNLPLALRNAAGVLAERTDIDVAEYIRGLRDARVRLDLVEASFSLSYDLLLPKQREQWCTLSVFPVDFNCAGAASVWEMDISPASEALNELVRWSLAEYVPVDDSTNPLAEGRYRLHDLARIFASSHLDSIARARVQQKHAEHYINVLSAANALYRQGGDNTLTGLELFDRDLVNIQVGHSWAKNVIIRLTEQLNTKNADKELEPALKLCSDFPDSGADLLYLRLAPRERIGWLEIAVDAAKLLNNRKTEGSHLRRLATAYCDLGETYKSVEFNEKALAIAREIGDRTDEGKALGNLAISYFNQGENQKAIQFYEQALGIFRKTGDRREEGETLGNLGNAFAELGNARKAIEYYEQDLAISREIGSRRGEGNSLGNLANAYAQLGESHKAVQFYEQALVIDREIGDRWGEGITLGNLGQIHNSLGESQKAVQFFEQALVIGREIGNRRNESINLISLGSTYAVLGASSKAIEFYEQGLAISREIGNRRVEGTALANTSLMFDEIGDRARAIDYANAALNIFEQIESPYTEQVKRLLASWQESDI